MNVKRRRQTIVCVLFAALLVILWIGSASADKVVMKNGDQISGTALSMTSGKLVFNPPYTNQIAIDWTEVARLTTDRPMEVSIGEEKTVKGKLVSAREETLVLEPENEPPTAPIRMAKVTAMRPYVAEEKWQLSGELAAGVIVETGNTDKESLNFDARMQFLKQPHRINLVGDFEYEKNDGSKTDDNLFITANYDYFLTRKWFLFVNDRFKRDEFADLTAMNAFGVGGGYQFWKSEAKNLSLRLGPNYVFQEYGSGQSFLDGDTGRNYAAAFLGIDFDIWAYKRVVQFFHNSNGIFSFEDGENWGVVTRTGFRIPLFWKLFATLQYNFDYEGQPADGAVSDDGKFLTKLGIKW